LIESVLGTADLLEQSLPTGSTEPQIAGRMEEEQKFHLGLGIGGCCCCFWSIFIIILLSISMTTLETGNYALKFSHYQQNVIGDPIVEPGVMWVGPLNSLILFPSVHQIVYFGQPSYKPLENEISLDSVHSRTRDGLQIYVRISLQWFLSPEHLKGIYKILGGAEDLLAGEVFDNKPSFSGSFVRITRGALTEVCSEYTAAQFFANQSIVEKRMFQRLRDTFNMRDKGFVINIAGLQVRDVDLPDAYEDSIADTQKEEQDFRTANAERLTKEIQLSTEQVKSIEKQSQLMVETEGKRDALMQENAAWVDEYLRFQLKQADSYAKVLKIMVSSNVSSPYETLFSLMRQRALKAHRETKLTLTM